MRVADTREAPPFSKALGGSVAAAELRCGEFLPTLLDGIDLVCLSPGLPTDLPLLAEVHARGIAVTGEIELFAQGLRELGWRDAAHVIAITGTNGKTTTTALTGHLCRSAGKATAVAGNISPAALDALMACEDAGSRPDIWVLELSSYQLETMDTLDADAATVLNLSEDHLDRHAGMAGYAAAKARIFRGCKVSVVNRDDMRVKAMAPAGAVSFGLGVPPAAGDYGLQELAGEPWLARGTQVLMPLRELPLAGLHNAANALAAMALCHAVGIDAEALLPGLRSFKGLPHRVELVAEIGGVHWYDDSKGTNVGATLAALEGLQRKVVLILGGEGKGQDFSPLAPAVSRHARSVILIGRDAALIRSALRDCGTPLQEAATLEAAVRLAVKQALPGDAVLLSPACASFDMFRNYEHRAQAFIAAVQQLMQARQTDTRVLQ